MFRVKNEITTFKVGRGHLLPIGVGDICMVNVEHEIGRLAEQNMAGSPKRMKAKLAWLYFCGTK
ncbi:hypothetical protein HAX54_013248, partial [Datura stramonium]|nr:hypothetical protein [Datura stramonium]